MFKFMLRDLLFIVSSLIDGHWSPDVWEGVPSLQCWKTVQNETSLSFFTILAVWASLPSPAASPIFKNGWDAVSILWSKHWLVAFNRNVTVLEQCLILEGLARGNLSRPLCPVEEWEWKLDFSRCQAHHIDIFLTKVTRRLLGIHCEGFWGMYIFSVATRLNGNA